MPTTKEEIIAVLLSHMPDHIPTIDDYDKPLEDYGLDSLDTADLLLALEEKYNLRISDDDIEILRSTNDMANYAQKQLASK